ncbi:MAG: FecR domain-containing protein [Chitinivibrionales bacterium]|nr:FecR domain-containing protein [Chitinivibrionales bacterium]
MSSLRTVLAMVACLAVGVTFGFAQQAGGGNEERVTVKTMVGQVEVRSGGTAVWRAARIGLPVRMGWDVRTYVESKAELEFESGTILRIGENSVVTLSKLLANKGAGESNSGVKVGTGQIWANVKKLTSTKSKFDFETPTAVASIRGTRLGINVGKEGTAIEVYEGTVMVRNKGATKEFPVLANVRAMIKQGSTGVDMAKFTEKEAASADVFKAPADTSKKANADTTKAKADSTKAKADTTKTKDTTKVKADTTNAGKVNAADTVGQGKKLAAAARADTIGEGKRLAAAAAADSIRQAAQAKSAAQADTAGAGSSNVRLVLQLTSPRDNSTINTTQIPVSGKTTPGAKVTVNHTAVTVSPGGTFATTIPIPDEAQDYAVNVIATLGSQEMDQRLTVTYQPTALPLSLTIATPVDGQVIKDKTIRVSGRTSPGATVTINGRTATVTPQGIISTDIALSERDIGDYNLEIVASDAQKEMSITRLVTIDASSPLINTSVPMITVTGLGQQATRTGQITINVTDKTPEDVITLDVTNNSSKQEFTHSSGDRENFSLDPGMNKVTIQAFDKARNMSNVVSGNIYYLPGPLTIRITDPENNPMIYEGIPPMPHNVTAPPISVRVEIEDNISNVPETIKYCQISGSGQTVQMRNNKDYSFTGELKINRGVNTFTIQAEDFAGNIATKTLTVVVKQ